MYTIHVHIGIHQIISIFNLIGWNSDNILSDSLKLLVRTLHLLVYIYYPVSLLVGACTNENETEPMFLVVLSIVTFVLAFRLYFILWKKNEILGFIRNLGTYLITDSEKFNKVNKTINIFMRFVWYLELMLVGSVIAMTIITSPIVSTEKMLPMNIYFPLDWKHNDIVYWIAFFFVIYEMVISLAASLLNMVVWYLLMSCGIKYQLLGNELKNLGIVDRDKILLTTNIILNDESVDSFLKASIELIKSHQYLQETTDQFKACFSNLFLIQIATSALSICGSVYALAFSSVKNPFQLGVYAVVMMYNFFDIFMVTHFGNEIKYWSSRLSYCLFECNWMDQSESCKKCILILMEVLKRTQILVIGKLYPLDLEIFTRILQLAYSLFNILQKIK